MPKPPVAWWRLENRKATIGTDIIGSLSESYIAGRHNNAVQRAGTGTYNIQFSQQDKMTIEWWMRNDTGSAITQTSNLNVMEMGYYSAVPYFAFYLTSPQTFYLKDHGGNQQFRNVSGSYSHANGAWAHYAYTWDFPASTHYFYVDGSSVALTDAGSGAVSANGTTCIVTVGALFTGSYNIAASFDNIKIYDYIKTDFSDRFDERGGMNDFIGMV